MFTDRFIKLPVVFSEGEDIGEGVIVDLRLNPFAIEYYCEERVTYNNESGQEIEQPAVRVYTKNDEHIVMMPIAEFERKLNDKF